MLNLLVFGLGVCTPFPRIHCCEAQPGLEKITGGVKKKKLKLRRSCVFLKLNVKMYPWTEMHGGADAH